MADPMKCWFTRGLPSVATATYEEGAILHFESRQAIVATKPDGELLALPLNQVSTASENPDVTKAKAKAKAEQEAASARMKAEADAAVQRLNEAKKEEAAATAAMQKAQQPSTQPIMAQAGK